MWYTWKKVCEVEDDDIDTISYGIMTRRVARISQMGGGFFGSLKEQ